MSHIYHVGDDSQHSSATMLRVCLLVQVSGHVWDDRRLSSATRLCGRHPSRCSAPLVFALRVACVCACVLMRLSHPRPPDRSQHGCTVGVLPGPTPCAPDAQAVWHRSQSANSCCAELCCVVVCCGASHTRSVEYAASTFCTVSSRTPPPRHGHGCGFVDLERHFAPLVAHLIR